MNGLNKKQWEAVVKAYIWSIANSATDYTSGDLDIIYDLLVKRECAAEDERRKAEAEKATAKRESDYNAEYEIVLGA